MTVQNATGMIAALAYIDGVGFHGIDVVLSSESPTINGAWRGNIRSARIAVAAIDWPDELQSKAVSFADAAGRLVTALGEDDVETAVAPSADVHGAWHALSDAGWSWLATAAGIRGGDSHRVGHDT